MKERHVKSGADVIIVARDAAVAAKSTDIVPELDAGLLFLGVTEK